MIRGEGEEGGVIYRGNLTLVRPLRAFEPNEMVILTIHGDAERIGPGWEAWFSWATHYDVFNADGSPLASETIHHSIAPWTEHDYCTDAIDLALGNMPEYGYDGDKRCQVYSRIEYK